MKKTALEDLHKETSSILVESELDEEELLDCRDNKRKLLFNKIYGKFSDR